MASDTIPGLRVYPNVVNEAQSAKLLTEIDSREWDTTLSRRVQHYGTRYDYRSKRVSETAPDLPENISKVAHFLKSKGIFDSVPNQVIVNEYTQRQGIAAHIDRNDFGPVVAGVNLGDEAVMIFRHPVHGKREVHLPSGSLLVMSGLARTEWTHEISKNLTYMVNGEKRRRPDNFRRISITFRTLN